MFDHLFAFPACLQAAGGILTAADLRGARPRRLEVVETRVMGKTLLTFPPPSSGAVAVSILKQVEARGVPVATSGTLGKHRLLEAMKHSFAMRMSLGDPGDRARPFLDLAALDATVADLLSTEYVLPFPYFPSLSLLSLSPLSLSLSLSFSVPLFLSLCSLCFE